MAGSTKVTVVLKMKFGPQARFSFHVPSSVVDPNDVLILGLIAVLEGCTRGKAISIEISLSAAAVGSATTGAAYVNEDKALMRFIDFNGVSHAYRVPGLLPAILDTDRETVKPAESHVVDYTDAITGNAKTQSNDAITAFVSGHRIENRKPIKAGRV